MRWSLPVRTGRPEVFDQDERDGRALVRTQLSASGAALEEVREAVALCPSGALSLIDGKERRSRAG